MIGKRTDHSLAEDRTDGAEEEEKREAGGGPEGTKSEAERGPGQPRGMRGNRRQPRGRPS